MISVRSLFSAWAFAVGFALQALAASEIRIVDGGQPRQFEIETGVVASSDSTNAPDIFLFEANKARTAFNRRRMTSDILVELNAGADPKKVGETVSVESLRLINAERRWYIFQVKEPALVLSVVEKLRAHADIASAEPILAKRKVRKFVPSDPLLPTEWHLNNTGANGALAGVDLHVTNTWAQYRGKGVVIAIIDDGLDTSHPDLAPHIDPALGYDWNDGDTDPTAHPAKGDFHGTECAGAAAAVGDNSAGVAGVAFEATIAGLRLISGDTTDETEAAAMLFKNQQIDIKNNSWGPDDDGMTLEAPGPLTLAALEESVRTGRGGKGTIFVFPGGNGLDTGDNANYDGYANSIYTIAVGAVSDQGFQTDYSEPGACLVVTVPGGSFGRPSIVTTDLQGPEGVNRIGEPDDLADLDYTSGFTGTSASVALTSGAIALMLNANPNLGWRDVQEILLRSATKVDPHDPDWDMNSAGLSFNHKFGAGLLNVDNAVALALIWSNLPPQTNLSSIQNNLNVAIPDNDPSGVTREFDFRSSSIRLEQVTLTANIAHPFRGNLTVTLVSPSGLESRLAEKHGDPGANYNNWKFMSVRHWGESSQGIWKVKIADLAPGDVGAVNSLRLDLFGTDAGNPRNLLIQSTEFSDREGGNGNGGIEPGETISQTFVLQNVGSVPVSGTARLISRTPGVRILNGESSFAEILPQAAGAIQIPFVYHLSEDVQCQSTLLFDLVTESGATRTTNSFRQKVGVPTVPWAVQTVDSAGMVGSYTSLALDQNGAAHISYYDVTDGHLKHAHQQDQNWIIETVDSAGNVGTFTSIALDNAGNPRISYRDVTLKQLKYASWNGSSWDIETVFAQDNSISSGSYSSLALDQNGSPRIAFMDETNGDLLYAQKSGGVWSFARVDTVDTTGSDISLALDSQNRPMISYRNVTQGDLKFAEWDGTAWQTQTVDSAGSVGFNTSLKIGRDGEPRICYRDSSNSDLKFVRRAAGGWQIEVVDSSGAVGSDSSLALDSQDRPRISYRDISNNALKYAAWNGSFWTTETVDADGSVGSYTSIALDRMDHTRISYRDISNGDLKFASLDQLDCLVYQPKVRPELSVTRSEAKIIISWPSQFPDFSLESSANLTDWTAVGGGSNQGAAIAIDLPITTATNRFFRLRK